MRSRASSMPRKAILFDVLAYIAYARIPITRAERAESRKPRIMPRYDSKLQEFLDFVLAQYVSQGRRRADQESWAA